jgi:hypothetical protein
MGRINEAWRVLGTLRAEPSVDRSHRSPCSRGPKTARRKVGGKVGREHFRLRQAVPGSAPGRMPTREGLPPMSEPLNETSHRRRECDRAELRAAHALKLGDHTAYLIATGQAASARRRRAEWELESAVRVDAVTARVLRVVDATVRTVLRES